MGGLADLRLEIIISLGKVIGETRVGSKIILPEDISREFNPNDLKIPTYARSFALKLRPYTRFREKAFSQSGDSIITTNYDILFDKALYELVFKEKYFLTDLFLGSDFRDPFSDDDAMVDPGKTIDLLKLHGSLNWLYCPRCQRMYVTSFTNSVLYLVKRKSKKPDPDITCFCGFFPLDGLIVAPSAYQDITNPHLKSIWMNAYHVLENANEWHFAGYSLPGEDLAVRALLHRAKESRRHQKKPTSVVVINTNKECLQTFKEFFRNDVKLINDNFKNYAQSTRI